MDSTKKLVHLSVCSGYSGIGMGFEFAGITVVFTIHVEIEAFAVFNLVKKIEEGKLGPGVVWPDLKTFPAKRFRGKIDILSGGFPCQPFSTAGKRQATRDSRHIYSYIGDIITECQPGIVFLENVEGIITAKCVDGTPVLLYVLRDLEERGYSCSWGIFSAAEVGAPHRRKRVFIFGANVANNNKGLQGRISRILQECPHELFVRKSSAWPARPRQPQHEWEPPRVC